MSIIIRRFEQEDISEMTLIWNEVVEDGIAFPQIEGMTIEEANAYFKKQTHCGVAYDKETNKVLGLYTLHPNNIGRCGHIGNASYAVSSKSRGKRIGEKLVLDCIKQAKAHGFKLLQFNAVVATNTIARHLYQRIGFYEVGKIPNGFCMKDGHFEDIYIYYYDLVNANIERE